MPIAVFRDQVLAASNGGGRRKLAWQAEKLDGFRRGWQRGACAHDASKVSIAL